jgi:GTP-binding protein EngB required for normal cell division
MQATFITTGSYEIVYSTIPGKTHQINHYKVGRKGMATIHLLNFIDEYGMTGKQVYIDQYGSPWVKRA